MFSPEGPTLRELAVQALSSVERGYDLLAPKFDHTSFRTPDSVLRAVAAELRRDGPYEDGLDLCCGTGAGVGALAGVCRRSVTGVDFSAGMLDVARRRVRAGGPRHADGRPDAPVPGSGTGASVPRATRAPAPAPRLAWVRADARALPFGRDAFDLVVSFGAFGHFLPRELPGLFAGVHAALRPGGCFAFPLVAPPRPLSAAYWMLLGFDVVMRVRNALWRPPFVMYYRTFRLADVTSELERAGFLVELRALDEFGRRRDGSPRVRAVLARRPAAGAQPAAGTVNS
ncbi:class I SAM-dependent methyltransferase [Streptomyces sp. NPDC006458]|uniref:class I SAM-dependent methyltransferase n=1 Tax=Streptomyces sp. NPDC006458 TaxID=3154302 RepID=UPI0033AE2E23